MVNVEKRKNLKRSGQSKREMLHLIHHHSERDGYLKNVKQSVAQSVYTVCSTV